MKTRYKKFAIEVAALIQDLPRNLINSNYSNQLIRSSSSPGANYRAACRAKSMADFTNKLKIVEEELDESLYFLELLQHFNAPLESRFVQITREGNELLSITVKSIKTSRSRLK